MKLRSTWPAALFLQVRMVNTAMSKRAEFLKSCWERMLSYETIMEYAKRFSGLTGSDREAEMEQARLEIEDRFPVKRTYTPSPKDVLLEREIEAWRERNVSSEPFEPEGQKERQSTVQTMQRSQLMSGVNRCDQKMDTDT